MIGKYLGVLALAAIALFVYLYFYLGLYRPVEISVATRGPFYMIYASHRGAYHEIGPTIAKVEKWAIDNNLRCEMTFGEYIDDPAAIDQDRLRSHGGCLLLSPFKSPLPEGFFYEERPARKFVIGHFDGAPSASPFKVYPKVENYIQQHRLKSSGPPIETYLIHGDKMNAEFLFPVD